VRIAGVERLLRRRTIAASTRGGAGGGEPDAEAAAAEHAGEDAAGGRALTAFGRTVPEEAFHLLAFDVAKRTLLVGWCRHRRRIAITTWWSLGPHASIRHLSGVNRPAISLTSTH
jgi:hypothetical protein